MQLVICTNLLTYQDRVLDRFGLQFFDFDPEPIKGISAQKIVAKVGSVSEARQLSILLCHQALEVDDITPLLTHDAPIGFVFHQTHEQLWALFQQVASTYPQRAVSYIYESSIEGPTIDFLRSLPTNLPCTTGVFDRSLIAYIEQFEQRSLGFFIKDLLNDLDIFACAEQVSRWQQQEPVPHIWQRLFDYEPLLPNQLEAYFATHETVKKHEIKLQIAKMLREKRLAGSDRK